MSRSPDPSPEDSAQHIAKLKFPRARLAYLLSSRRRNPREQAPLRYGLKDSDPEVRRAAVQWVAEENLVGFRPQVEQVLHGEPISSDLFLATLAALEILDGKDPKEFDNTPAAKYVLPILKDPARAAAVRVQALRLVDTVLLKRKGETPAEPEPDTIARVGGAPNVAIEYGLMEELVESNDSALRLEAVRALQHSPGGRAEALLRRVAADAENSENLRAEAVVGLGGREISAESKSLLLELLRGDDATLQIEALRSLRSYVKADETIEREIAKLAETKVGSRPPLAAQIALLVGEKKPGFSEKPGFLTGGDPQAGRRVFFHPNGPGCYRCHTVDGRGGRIGPDLSRIGGSRNRERLAESILKPSREIAPQFTAWTFIMRSGKVRTGMLIGDTRDDVQRIGTGEGRIVELTASGIEQRHPQQKSIMPEELARRMTRGEFRDLLAFLSRLR